MTEYSHYLNFDNEATHLIDRKYQQIFCEFLMSLGFDSMGYLEKTEGFTKTPDGLGYENDNFVVRPYYWGEDDDASTYPNFTDKKNNIHIWWYKYPLRGSTSNVNLTFKHFVEWANRE